MPTRYLRLDLSYEDGANVSRYSFAVADNIKRILREDMPYVKVRFVRDAPTEEALDEPRVKL